jgi:Tfp pilus assembly protein FimT
MVTVAVIGIVTAIAVPSTLTYLDRYRLGMSVRDVERELQFARLKAVSTSQAMRLRFNCPTARSFRALEVIGTPAAPDVRDSASDRCDQTTYPYRANGADTSRTTRPNNDGAVRYLQVGVTTLAAPTLEFWADGTVHADTGAGNPWPAVGNAGATITLTRKSETKNSVVNGLGKIQMDR